MSRYALHGVSFFVGLLMAAGLAVAGMTQPHKIVAFLDVAGAWEPDLMLVMATAVATTLVLYRLSLKRQAPLLSERFLVPSRRDIDGRLLAGAAFFGIGWGLTGICPGPALASAATGSAGVLTFLAAMTAGMALLGFYDRWAAARRGPALRTGLRAAVPTASRAKGRVAS